MLDVESMTLWRMHSLLPLPGRFCCDSWKKGEFWSTGPWPLAQEKSMGDSCVRLSIPIVVFLKRPLKAEESEGGRPPFVAVDWLVLQLSKVGKQVAAMPWASGIRHQAPTRINHGDWGAFGRLESPSIRLARPSLKKESPCNGAELLLLNSSNHKPQSSSFERSNFSCL